MKGLRSVAESGGEDPSSNEVVQELRPRRPETPESTKPPAYPPEGFVRMQEKDPRPKPTKTLTHFEMKDINDAKDKIRSSMEKADGKYSVFDFYWEHGFFQYVARHQMFENVTLFIIMLNALWMWIDTDFNGASLMLSAPHFQIMEHLFCVYFSTELYIRFRAFKRKCNVVFDAWFVFDSFLVVLMVLENWIFNILELLFGMPSPLGENTAIIRLFRLLRLTRLVRMLRSMPELLILVKGMITAMKSVFYVLCLLAIIVYVAAIAMTQLAQNTALNGGIINAGTEDEGECFFFTSVSKSMYTLLIYGTFLDNLADFLNTVWSESYACLFLAFVFIFFACLTALNMLIGVLCEVVASVAESERDEIQTFLVTEKMCKIVKGLDTDYNGSISVNEFKQILDYPEALDALRDVDVDPTTLVDFADMFFKEDENGKIDDLPFENFMEMVLSLRGSNEATVKDVMSVWRQVNPMFAAPQKELAGLRSASETIRTQLLETKLRLGVKIKQLQKEVAAMAGGNPQAG